MKLQLYIEGQIVDFFDDETVTINSSVQNIKDISKIFTDYTQTFKVPASPKNNLIFSHWYNPDITNGFDAGLRVDASLELNMIPFKIGSVQLNAATLKNGVIVDYSLTFYGNIVKLKDLMGDDLLTDLNLDAYSHSYNSANVFSGFTSSALFAGDVIYPLMSFETDRYYSFGDQSDFDIRANSAKPGKGVRWNELKPAIKLHTIIAAIEVKYGITFSTQFLGTHQFADIFMLASRDKGLLEAKGIPTIMTFNPGAETVFDMNFNTGSCVVRVEPEAGFEDVPYTITKRIDLTDSTSFELVGIGDVEEIKLSTEAYKTVEWLISASGQFEYIAYVTLDGITPTTTYTGNTGVQTALGHVYFTDYYDGESVSKGQLPKMRVADFLAGIIKMFNLIIEPIGANEFNVDNLESWLGIGEVKDLKEYIDISEVNLTNTSIYREINFNYQESETILQDNFNGNNHIYYGDLEYSTGGDGEVFDISLPFENVIGNRITDEDASVLGDTISRVRTYLMLDSEMEEVTTEPILFYNTGITDVFTTDDPTIEIQFVEDDGTTINTPVYNNVGQEDDTLSYSLNWGAETSTWTFSTFNDSLFANYWTDYVTGLYNSQTRLYQIKGILPPIVLSNLKLNDKLLINNRRYLINDYKANLTTGEVTFHLINDL